MSSASPSPSLIRAKITSAGSALLRIRMKHEMETGQRKDAQGRPLAAWHIEAFSLRVNGQLALHAQLGTGISKDPFLELQLRGVKAGDSLQLDWTDNQGAKRSDSSSIQA